MSKYHVNPKTGDPGKCSAEKSCPFGDMDSDHYSSPEEAREAYEAANAGESIPTTSKKNVPPTGFTATGYVGPNGDIAIAEAYGSGDGDIVYRRAGDDDWQAVDSSGRLLQAETPSGRYSSAEEAGAALNESKATPGAKSILSNIEFEGHEDHQNLKKEQLEKYLKEMENAPSSLEASKYAWYALSLNGKGRGQETLHNLYLSNVEKYESRWEEGNKFDTSIEGPISLTNKNGLAASKDVGVYSNSDGTYNVYRRGAGPAVSLSKSENGWMVGSGPGSYRFIAKNKAAGKRAMVILHDLEVANKTGKWNSKYSIEEARQNVGELHSINPGGFSYNAVPKLMENLDRLEGNS